MEVSGLNGLRYDEESALNSLLDAFGSVFSLNDIASAYCEADRNVDIASEILFRMQGNTSVERKNGETLESSRANNSRNCSRVNGDFTAPKQIWRLVSASSNATNSELKKDEPLESSSSDSSQNSCQTNGDSRTVKQNWQPISASSNTSNSKLKKDKPLESSSSDNSQNSCQANGDSRTVKQKWRPVSASSNTTNSELKKDKPLESSSSDSCQNYCQANGDSRIVKQKWRPVSGGIVSSMLGKGYMKSAPSTNGSSPRTKPLKVDSKEWPASVFWGEGRKSSPPKEDRLHKDMEDFLFKMLGAGFQLERNVIKEVLDSCGYDMQKSMERLLDRSAMSLDEGNKILGESSKKTNDKHPISEEPSHKKNIGLNTNGGTRQKKDRYDLQKEIWTALFSAPERLDELPTRRVRAGQRSIALGEPVEGPLIDFDSESKVDRVHSQEDKKDDEDEEYGFQALRRAVTEYRGTMKEYYKAAIDAFAKGDKDLANRLVEQGQFFREKACQADEESNQKIFETRGPDAEDEISLDLHEHGAKEAIRLLKCHLSSLAGIPSFKYLKLILETNEEDSSKGRRRQSVKRLLEKESITWSEGETCGVIRIRLDKINPKSLSFGKKMPSL
ncbi:hypothetical protein ERO13_A10G025100v2 [Gossypium hirsutum]|uniref:UBA domain-containing protein n=2 Tax=Gossypium TaxID=3633 RepID=A0A5D2XGI4_GOSMU|nr:putative nuclear RNA export factor SDE5 [Gossypium hirsutum]KAG4178175.1 hypothetical protein ERO13_A10G025100v2 [Gossypium hirsutum]TYJ13098.1 hypothetical protein E1A91_A10G028200v1 [Gossypium mustelinum]TYJ13099.1 hypothetical protein E1A91_A10G028200v1 [Gossypium mustelinum]